MRHKIALFYALITSLCFVTAALLVLHGLGFRINRSDSLPGLLYRAVPLQESEALYPGDCVLIDLTRLSNPVIARGMERGYVSAAFNQPMLKRIVALPGDTVAIRDGALFVNGKMTTRLTVASRDAGGGRLSAWPTPLTLAPDSYWLVSDPDRGFDSRYFGPLPRSAFTHKARALGFKTRYNGRTER